MDIENQIADRAQLRTVYREPAQGVLDKVIDHIDEGAAGFIARSPFVVLATSTDGRGDASPRGGPPGFVRVLDEHRLAWGDLTGNNRLDSFGNIVEQPDIGMLFIVPGVLETLRLSGSASLVQDQQILEACAIDGRLPKTAVVVTVQECYIQCGAALRRSGLWDTDTWPDDESRPSGAAILKDHLGTDIPADDIEAGLKDYYDNHIWVAGGRDD
ncbi:MSMEG_1061 family FMN-dependent PPOX-type flavoprotein [Ilumatobacter nonamiensis]|uniref:MSMEG_1061 family FMN-dependent PPOX-type flavoprotein n=1 Tax=Ilumatobacter nonamiensis TaxID=467093 RepID=UPI000346246E|nr:MSMEG_1061 family FMN-dependent PPOX-type flavoprotein [Ilumatobacter nonamiensis]